MHLVGLAILQTHTHTYQHIYAHIYTYMYMCIYIYKIERFDIPAVVLKKDSIHLGHDVMSIGKVLPTVLTNFLPACLG
jgi:hypothetical protein